MAPELEGFIAFWIFASALFIGLLLWNYDKHKDDDPGPMPF